MTSPSKRCEILQKMYGCCVVLEVKEIAEGNLRYQATANAFEWDSSKTVPCPPPITSCEGANRLKEEAQHIALDELDRELAAMYEDEYALGPEY